MAKNRDNHPFLLILVGLVIFFFSACGNEEKPSRRTTNHVVNNGPSEHQGEAEPDGSNAEPAEPDDQDHPTPEPTVTPNPNPEDPPPVEGPDPIAGLILPALINSPENGASVQQADIITGKTQYEVMKYMKPGITENDLTDFISKSFTSNGSQGLAFEIIVGSGPNSTDLHHAGGTRTLQNDDLVVIDIGAQYNGYCADITRTYPAGGVFTPRQREVYKLVFDALRSVAAQMKPNKMSLQDAHNWVVQFFRNSPLRAKDSSGGEQTMDQFFTHYLSHYLGRVVHDGGDTSAPVRPGEIFTIEPGLYIESEGFGIRIEDDFLVTETEVKSLLNTLPADPDTVEKIMTKRP